MSLLITLRRKGARINQILYLMIILLGIGLISCGTKNIKADSFGANKTIITDVKYNSYSDKSELVIKGSDVLKYTVYKSYNPSKINIEVFESDFDKKVLNDIEGVNDKIISAIKCNVEEKGSRAVLALHVTDDVEFNVTPNKDVLTIEFKKDINEMLSLKKEEVFKMENDEIERKFEIISVDDSESDSDNIKYVSSTETSIKTAKLIENEIDADFPDVAEIDKVIVNDSSDGINVIICGKGKLDDYTTLELTEPTRLILDVWNATNAVKEKSILVASNSIDMIDVSEHRNKVRFVFNSTAEKLPPYSLTNENDKIMVAVNDDSDSGSYKAVITSLDFEYKEVMSKVILTTNNIIEYEVKEGEKKKIVIDIGNVRIPGKLRRPLDTSEFASNITNVEAKKTDGGVSLEISLREEVPFNVVQDETKLYIEVENPFEVVEKIKEEVVVKQVKADAEESAEETTVDDVKSAMTSQVIEEAKQYQIPTEDLPIPATSKKGLLLKEIEDAYRSIDDIGKVKKEEKKVYKGTKMSLDFKDADIHNVLRLIAEVSGFNVVTSDDVKGKVSIHLSNVPWDQALDVILSVKDLGMVKKDNIIQVVPKAKLEAEEERKRAALKKRKEEKLDEIKNKQKALEELEPLVLRIVPVNYSNVNELKDQIAAFLSKRGSVTVDERTNVLIIKDIEENVNEAVNLVARLDTATPQVLIEARIVEASTNFTRQLGVQWGGNFTADYAHSNALPYTFPSSVNVGGAAGSGNYAVDLPATVNQNAGGAIGFSFGHIANAMTLDMRLSAMETSGEGKIISSPRVVTLDNTQAVIQQGTSIPYETTSDEGTETEFVDANLSLTVTPHITADGSIKMEIKASKNAPNMSIVSEGKPAIDKKEAQTEILVRDGETTVIGGIYVVDESESEGGVPFFSKLPFVGWMFKTENKIKTRNELLIFITPRIVKPGDKVSF